MDIPAPKYTLYETPEKLVITNKSSDQALHIDRTTGTFSLGAAQSNVQAADVRPIFGILGSIDLITGRHLLVITSCTRVGSILGSTLLRVKSADIIAIQPTSSIQRKIDEPYVRLLNASLGGHNPFYFSYEMDVSNTAQRQSRVDKSLPIAQRADNRFVYNHILLKELYALQAHDFITIAVLGFMEVRDLEIDGKHFTYALISRRSRHRAGTRYHVRGVDETGKVANFVETEQIVVFKGELMSFVQTRGSIPLYWSQYPNLKYKPAIRIFDEGKAEEAFRAHTADHIAHYGDTVMLDLIDQKGMEGTLGSMFASISKRVSKDLKHVAFDFHKQCAKMRYDRLTILMDQISEDMDRHGFFYEKDGSIVQSQSGVCRTNCIDCLDRTNVVQSMVARIVLKRQLIHFKILNENSNLEDHAAVERFLKNVWANNADTLSVQYSGTPALKTDYTRTGKRTKKGMLADGWYSLKRYVLNNFLDGWRQDSIDLFTGAFVVDKSVPSPLGGRRQTSLLFKILMLFIVMLTAVSLFVLPRGSDLPSRMILVAVWIVSFYLLWKVLVKFGRRLVDRPMLVPR